MTTSTTTTTTTTLPPLIKKVEISYPINESRIDIGSDGEILWRSSESATDIVKIELYKGGVFNSLISDSEPNTGIYVWTLGDLEGGTDYQIKLSWIGATELPENEDISDPRWDALKKLINK